MPFSKQVAEMALTLSGRCCCICHKFCGNKIELHHIVQEAEGGNSEFDNCIPLCSDCHTDVKSYNINHPKGRKYSNTELKKHRDIWFASVKRFNSGKADFDIEINQKVIGNKNIVAGRDIINTKKVIKKNEIITDPGGRHITEQDAYMIKEKVKQYSELMKDANLDPNPAKIWTKLNKHFRVSSYREIPFGFANEALKLISIEIAMARPKVRRRNPEAWRKQYYNAIWAAVNQLGMQKEQVYEFVNENIAVKKKITSLTELTQSQLQELDRKLKAKLKNPLTIITFR